MSQKTDLATRWIVRPRPDPGAALRLVCFSYAGAGSSAFRQWPAALPGDVELLAIELPGREARIREPRFERLAPLVAALTDAAAPRIDPPFAIYGHSLGALVGFGFACELRRRGLPGPCHLFVSGRRAPQLPEPSSLATLPDRELLAALRRLGGVPDIVFADPDLVAWYLPIIRADVRISELEVIADDAPLACPITAFGGLSDERARPAEITAWRSQTSAAFDHELFPGGHFFIQTERDGFLGSLARRLSRITTPP
jgi:medium-chain acyl-[acyl-carrier-protein] hydrolase